MSESDEEQKIISNGLEHFLLLINMIIFYCRSMVLKLMPWEGICYKTLTPALDMCSSYVFYTVFNMCIVLGFIDSRLSFFACTI